MGDAIQHDAAAGAGPVFDDDLLAQTIGQADWRQCARRNPVPPPGGKPTSSLTIRDGQVSARAARQKRGKNGGSGRQLQKAATLKFHDIRSLNPGDTISPANIIRP